MQKQVDLKTSLGKRKFPRRNYRRGIGALYKGRYFTSQIGALGEGGLSFVASSELPVDEEILLTFCLPNLKLSIVRAQIKNHNKSKLGHLVGVMFLDLPFHERRFIRTFVAARQVGEESEY